MFKIARVILFFVIFGSVAAYAEVAAPLGIEIGKSTCDDVKAKYRIISEEAGDGAGMGYYYTVSTENLPLKNITEVIINCSDQGIVRAVLLETNKDNFESFFSSISSKYKLLEKDLPFVGNKEALFSADNCMIRLKALHMSFKMTITYCNKELSDLLQARTAREAQAKKQAQDNAL